MTQVVIVCPFPPCGASPEVIPTMPRQTRRTTPHPHLPTDGRGVIQQHDMFDYINGNGRGMSCPASLMHYPLGPDERRALAEQAAALQPHIDASEHPSHARWDVFRRKSGRPLPKSESLRPWGRKGNQPKDGSSAWVLGGREDEDVISSREDKRGAVPRGVTGHNIGGTGMLDELAGLINAAGSNAAEARQSLGEAIEALERAKGALLEAMGQSTSETLSDYLVFLNRAITECQDAQGQIDAGHDKGQEYIGRLSGA